MIEIAVGFGKYESLESSSSIESNRNHVDTEEGYAAKASENYQHNLCHEPISSKSSCRKCGKQFLANSSIVYCHTCCPIKVKSAIKFFVLKKEHRKNGPSRRTILNFMFVNDHERKKNDKSLLAALKKMVDSKELIQGWYSRI